MHSHHTRNGLRPVSPARNQTTTEGKARGTGPGAGWDNYFGLKYFGQGLLIPGG
jgi:hypothetical protein